jgi:homoserine O-succinyltransferase
MPVIVHARESHPFLPSLDDSAAIEAERARRQDIRPLEIAIVNLMADKQATERQLAAWLGNTMLQINLTFAATDTYVARIDEGRVSKNTPVDHIRKFYNPFSAIAGRNFDGLIVTGVNALKPRVEHEDIWPQVQDILDWSDRHVFSSYFLCWGAKAALKHFHDIDSIKGKQKTFGLFPHRLVDNKTGILTGFPDQFSIPVARWKSPRKADIARNPALEIAAECPESGPNILVEPATARDGHTVYARRVYLLSHPEYETDTLKNEYERDVALDPDTPIPQYYYPNNDPKQTPINTWRHTGHIYTNWITSIYGATPYELGMIGGCTAKNA